MFKYTRGMAWVALIIFGAVLSPQDSDARLRGLHDGFLCADCHISADGYAGSLFDQTPSCLNSGVNCHNDPGVVEIDLAEADASQLFGKYTAIGAASSRGTSHAWGVPYVEPGAGATTPRAIRQDNYIRGILACSSCHYPHYTPFGSLTTEPLLKLDNTSDALCLDCHRSWNVTSVSTAPPAGKVMSHPVGVTLNPVLEGYTAPLNPQGFAGSELKLVGASSDKVSCSTCHGVHFADSDPNTDATMTGLSPVPLGQGVLLRRYNDSQLCKDCHRYQQHGPIATPAKWQDCRNCHSPHNVNNNLKLIKFDNFSGPEGWVTPTFDNLTTNLAERTDGKQGLCDACHALDTTGVFGGWSSGHQLKGINRSEAWKVNCISCHAHEFGDGSSVGSFAAGGAAACNSSCHGYPPISNVQGIDGYAVGYAGLDESATPHAKHAADYPFTTYNCKACHYDSSGASRDLHEDGDYRSVIFGLYSWSSGTWGNYSSAASKYSCDTVYCHSNGAPLNVGIAIPNDNTIAWSDPQVALGCGGCHDANPDTNVHQSHTLGNYNLDCINCHATVVSANDTISSKSLHVNSAKNVAFGGLTALGSYASPTCTNTYCHGNFPNGANATPDWDGTAACGTCHNVASPMPLHIAVSHDRHVTVAPYKYGFDCAYCHDEQMDEGDNSSLTSYAGHVNGVKSIKFLNDLQGRTNFDGFYTGGKCKDTYCHSAGTSTVSADFFVNDTSVLWSNAVTTCDSCHGDSTLGGWTSAMPNYTTSVSIKENSHNAHVIGNGYDCNICHDTIVGDDNASIDDTAKHVDGDYDVVFAAPYNGGGAIYIEGNPGTCENVWCHGGVGSSVDWGATISCEDCHNTSSADVDDFTFDNFTMAQINFTQWTTVGHGKPAISKVCLDCHDDSSTHGDAVNPFRVYSATTPNGLCNKAGCHSSTPLTHNTAETSKVDGGGRYTFDMKCIDCHDPHGDDNIFMIHSTVTLPDDTQGYTSSDLYGIPYGTTPVNIDFTASGVGDYGSMDTVNNISKICNVCHAQTTDINNLDGSPGTSTKLRYQRNQGAGTIDADHDDTQDCADSCHKHKNGFEGESCVACHGMPPSSADTLLGGATNPSSTASGSISTGFGAHTTHTNKYGNCRPCHEDGMSTPDLEGGTGFDDNIRIDFTGDGTLGTYSTGSYDGQNAVAIGYYGYDGDGIGGTGGSMVCSLVKCHGSAITGDMAGSDPTPVWTNPLTGDCGTCHATAATAQTDSSHEVHAETNSIDCPYCHTPETATTHVDSNIDFNDATTSKAATGVCDTCHVDVTGAKNEWTAGTAQVCQDCHVTTDADTDNFTFTFFTSGTMAQARINDTDWTTRGHGRTTTVYPISGNQAAELVCGNCHETDVLVKGHQSGASYFRLKATDDPDTLCLDCHGSGAQINALGLRAAASVLSLVTSYQSHTEANLIAAGYSTGNWAGAIPKCIDCHDPHGDGNNIFMMHSKVADEGSDGVGIPANFPNNSTVNFIDVVGANSYDDGGAGTQSLCVVCHDNTTHNGDGTGHLYASTDCRACHDHKLGFTPAGECDDCHNAALDVDDFSYGNNTTAQVDFTAWTTTGHGRTTPFPSGNQAASLECPDCHDDTVDHNDPLNPFRLYSSDPDQLCDICHGPDGTASKKGIFNHSSSTTAAKVAGGGRYKFKIKCIDCHDPHGDDNAFMMHSTVAQPADDLTDWETSDQYGVPDAGVTWENIDFPDGSSASQSSTSGATAPVKVCNVCHSRTVDYDGPDPDDETRYQRTGSTDAHYVGQDCTGSCHQHKKAFEGEACNVCHGMPPISAATLIGGGSNPSGSIIFGAHSTHVVRFNNSCQECHEGGMQDTSDFIAKRIDLDFSGGYGSYTTGKYYGQPIVNSTNEYPYIGAGYGGEGSVGNYRCENVRCHGTSMGADIFGNDTTPEWDDPTTGECGTCHRATKATMTVAGSHNTHANVNDIDCPYCHMPDTDPTHVDSNIDFEDTNTSLAATTTCENCHADVIGAGAKADWPSATAQTCEECHVTDVADVDHFTFGFFTSAGMTQARINDTDWTTRGHGRTTTAYPISGNQAAELVCGNCHETDVLVKGHQSGASYFRLKATDDPDTLCLDCHGSGAQINALGLRAAASVLSLVTSYQSHTEANLIAAGYSTGNWAGAIPKCIDCHDPHGDGNNIFMMHSKVADEGSDGVGIPANFPNNSTVNFIDVVGANSYDDGGAGSESLCVVCHDNTSHDGNDGASHNWESTDCSSCHDHKLGFFPAACDGCHGNPPGVDSKFGPSLDPGDYEWLDDTGGAHVAHNDLGETCDECHTSNSGGDTAHNSVTTNKANASIITMDGTFSFGNLSGYKTTVSTEDDTCSDVTCHGGRAYERKWLSAGNISSCDDCHGGRASDTFTQITTGSHNKHTNDAGTNYDLVCTECHIDNGTLDHYSAQFVDITTAITYNRAAPFKTFTTGSEWDTCDATYCHGDTLPLQAQGINVTPTWGDGTYTGCENCHKSKGDAANMAAPHPRHVTPGAGEYDFGCVKCHNATVSDNFTISTKANHASGTVNVAFDEDGTYNGATERQCLNTYCHSFATITGVGPFLMGNYTADWDDVPLSGKTGAGKECSYCHGDETLGGWTSAMPNYDNLTLKENSHAKHVNGGYDCNVCHGPVVGADNASIEATGIGLHINGSYDVDLSPNNGTYSTTTQICSNVDCHGGNPATWGSTSINCFSCHEGVDDGSLTEKPFSTPGNGANAVSLAQYTTTGHGLRGGVFYKYNDSLQGAGLWNTSGEGCYSSEGGCHSLAAGHITKDATDPFRLGNYSTNIDGLCATCHGTELSHTATATGNPKSRTWPFTTKCVDCHDPHGDANIRMIRSSINTPQLDGSLSGGSNAKGVPTTDGVMVDVTFTNNSGFEEAGGSAGVDAGTGDGICEICHTNNAANIGTAVDWYNMQGDDDATQHSNNAGKKCSDCHGHDEGFAGAGGCDGCHTWPPTIGDGSNYMDDAKEGKGRHRSHFTHLSSVLVSSGAYTYVNVSTATADGFGLGLNKDLCGVCHSNLLVNHREAVPTRSIEFGDGDTTYSFNGGAPNYDGIVDESSNNFMKSCSNVSCHFQDSAGWQDPDEPKF